MNNFDKVKEFHKFCDINQISFDDNKSILFRLSLIKEEVDELITAIETKNKVEIIDALGDILYVVYGFFDVLNIDANKVFSIIHNSNLTKFCKNMEQVQETIEYYNKNLIHRYKNLTYDKVLNYYIVKNNNGKILKSINYKPPTPDLENLLHDK